jgi:hypothetical protein
MRKGTIALSMWSSGNIKDLIVSPTSVSLEDQEILALSLEMKLTILIQRIVATAPQR